MREGRIFKTLGGPNGSIIFMGWQIRQVEIERIFRTPGSPSHEPTCFVVDVCEAVDRHTKQPHTINAIDIEEIVDDKGQWILQGFPKPTLDKPVMLSKREKLVT